VRDWAKKVWIGRQRGKKTHLGGENKMEKGKKSLQQKLLLGGGKKGVERLPSPAREMGENG